MFKRYPVRNFVISEAVIFSWSVMYVNACEQEGDMIHIPADSVKLFQWLAVVADKLQRNKDVPAKAKIKQPQASNL